MQVSAASSVMSRIGAIEARISQLASYGTSPTAPAATARTSATASAASLAAASAALGGTTSSSSSDFAAVLAEAGIAAPSGSTAVGALTGGLPAAAAPVTGDALVTEARRFLGVPYLLGGTTEAGIDCSGLVQRALGALGVDMPRVAREQMTQGTPVASLAEAAPGDLLVFGGGSHIAVYLGGGRMIDAPKPGDVVRERDVYTTPTAIRRVLPTAAEAAATAAAAATATTASSPVAQAEQLLAAAAARRSALTTRVGDAA